MTEAAVGKEISVASPIRCSPWIPVCRSLESIRFWGDWPGRLWHVHIVDAVNEDDARLAGVRDWHKEHTVAIRVRIVDEVTRPQLFGPHTGAVLDVIDQAGRLDAATVKALANSMHPAADEAYAKVWEKWMALEYRDVAGARSPINEGFNLIRSEMLGRARDIDDSNIIMTEVDIDIEVPMLNAEWSIACDAMSHAAMGFGAPEIMEAEDKRALTSAWVAVFGRMP